jgi:hypothetical protein
MEFMIYAFAATFGLYLFASILIIDPNELRFAESSFTAAGEESGY